MHCCANFWGSSETYSGQLSLLHSKTLLNIGSLRVIDISCADAEADKTDKDKSAHIAVSHFVIRSEMILSYMKGAGVCT